jgi:RNA polymerase sigma factor (sigma-70 family)
LTRAYLSWRKLRDPASAEAYVRRILVNAAINENRKRQRRPEVLHAEVPEASESLDDPATRLGIWQELNMLSAQQRAVLVLRYYEGLSEAEIARALGCAPGTVKSHASRGLALLKSRWTTADSEVGADKRPTNGGR